MTRFALVLLALTIVACGDDRYAAERARVEQLVPGADEVRCSESPRAVDCKGTLKGRPLFCAFRYEEGGRAYSGSSSCWTER